MKKKSILIIAIAVVGLIITGMVILVNSNEKELHAGNNTGSTEDKQTGTESFTEEETGTEGFTEEETETQADGEIQEVTTSTVPSYTAAELRELYEKDPTFMESIDRDGDGLTMDEYREKQANGTLTWEDIENLDSSEMSKEEYERRMADGVFYGEEIEREDGTSYIILDNGDIIEHGDELPGGGVWLDPDNWFN